MNPLLDALGYIGDSLDKPGRAVRGLLAGNPNEAAAIVPFSDTLGLTDPGQRVSGRDLLGRYGLSTGNDLADTALGMGAEVALDPTTYLGTGLGKMLGSRLGSGLERAAAARGPGFDTAADDVGRMLADYARSGPSAADLGLAERRVANLKGSSAADRLMSEIPPGSNVLGAGAEGIAFGTPHGDVVRLGRILDGQGVGRPVSPDVLQATRAVDVPAGAQTWRVERMPRASVIPNPDLAAGYQATLSDNLASQGLAFGDAKPANFGLLNGRPVAVDPGSIDVLPTFAGEFSPVVSAAEPGLLTRTILEALGGQGAMQRAVNAGRTAPDYSRTLGFAGGVAGGGLGGIGPAMRGDL